MLYESSRVQSPKSAYAVAFAIGITEFGMDAFVRPNISAEYVVSERTEDSNPSVATSFRHLAWLYSDIMRLASYLLPIRALAGKSKFDVDAFRNELF